MLTLQGEPGDPGPEGIQGLAGLPGARVSSGCWFVVLFKVNQMFIINYII